MNYENMSDFEVNKAVAHKRFEGNSLFIDGYESGMLKISDYCNSPSDAWPIIEKVWGTLMSVTSYDYGVGVGESKTTIWDARMHMYGDSKLRAAMIVYLMMQESN